MNPEGMDIMFWPVDDGKPNLKPLSGKITSAEFNFTEPDEVVDATPLTKTWSTDFSMSPNEFKTIAKMFGFASPEDDYDHVPDWEDEESGDHTCSCAVLGSNAPCGHCTDCPVCNCTVCEDFHFTDKGERCPRCRECNKLHDIRADGLCPYNLQVSSRLTQGDLLDKFNEFPDEELDDRLARIATLVATDILETVNQTYTKGSQIARKLADDYELATEIDTTTNE